MPARVEVGGLNVGAMSPIRGLTWSELRQPSGDQIRGGGGAFWDASWQTPRASRGWRHPKEYIGATVKIYSFASFEEGTGILTDYDPETRTWFAIGLCQDLVNYPCLKKVGTDWIPTSVLDDVINSAITNFGAPFHLPTPISLNPVVKDKTGTFDDSLGQLTLKAGIRNLKDLLDAVAVIQNKRWFVDATGAILMLDDRTTPNFYFAPGQAQMATTDDNYVTDLFGLAPTTLNATTGDATATTVQVADYTSSLIPGVLMERRKRAYIDLSAQGLFTTVTAKANLVTRLGSALPRYKFTNLLSVTPQTARRGGVPLHPWAFRCGDMGQMANVDDTHGNLLFGITTNVLINKVTKVFDSTTVILEPMDFIPRDFTGALADAMAPDTNQDPALSSIYLDQASFTYTPPRPIVQIAGGLRQPKRPWQPFAR